MRLSQSLRAVALAGFASAVGLASTFALARALRSRASVASHQRQEPEAWWEPVTPTSPGSVAQGRKLFLGNCAHCHGADASGDEGPDLHDLQVSDRFVARMIRMGEPHEMPAFAKKFGGPDIAALTAYLRSLE